MWPYPKRWLLFLIGISIIGIILVSFNWAWLSFLMVLPERLK